MLKSGIGTMSWRVTEFGGTPELVPVMLRTYMPGGVEAGTVMFMPERPSEPTATVTLVGETEKSGSGERDPIAETDVVKSTFKPLVPPNPFRLGISKNGLVVLSPLATWIIPELGNRSKYGSLLNLAVCTVSGTDANVPAWIVTQTPPGTLVVVQPVWNLIGMFSTGVRTV